jgi:hypothetical protein
MATQSERDTHDHIAKVRANIIQVVQDLTARGAVHDFSKLNKPEVDIFAEVSPQLSALTYGSDEYMAMLAKLKPAIDHHYQANDHHPEHWENGVSGMSLLSILEMLCDWRAAGERVKDGNLAQSITFNAQRFGIDNQLSSILRNTAKELGWIEGE